MLPDPLHPAVIHFPIVLALLAPVIAAALLWAVEARRLPARAWAAVVVLQLAVALAGWVAAETGEDEEDRVERVVAEAPIEAHEEAAERFLWLAGLAVPLAAAGLLAGRAGRVARIATLAATIGVAWTVVEVGRLGGDLVYRHGAADAYRDGAATDGGTAARRAYDHHDEDDD